MNAAATIYRELEGQLTAALESLPDKPEENGQSTLFALWHLATGCAYSATQAMKHSLPSLSSTQEQTLRELVQRRLAGEPLSYITERQHFMGIEMLAGPEALVPRAETELLAYRAIELARDVALQMSSPVVVDVCTGSGNLALAIALHVPSARVYASDLSIDAISLAKRNAQHLNLQNRVDLRTGDLLAPFEATELAGHVDLLTCNPPYISSERVKQMPLEISQHEPSLAFDGGPFGVSILMRLIEDAPRLIRSGGWLVFEVGLGQGSALARRLKANEQYVDIHTHTDFKGNIRALSARLG